MRTSFYASEEHFVHHMAPIWEALPVRARGRFVVHRNLTGKLRRFNLPIDTLALSANDGLVVVASYRDLKHARKTNPVAYMEHGAGQAYVDSDSGSYIGATDREGVRLILTPGPHSFERAVQAYPHLPVEMVGTPKLDGLTKLVEGWKPPASMGEATVALSFHWDAIGISPEARSAWRAFTPKAFKLAGKVGRLIGHGHPKAMGSYAKSYAQHGLDIYHYFGDVVRDADVYVCDNSSTIFEFAATGKPVVLMNAPWYRKTVEHGLRFWEFADIGPQVDSPTQLAAAVASVLTDDRWATRRAEITERLYTNRGGAAKAAAKALGRVGW